MNPLSEWHGRLPSDWPLVPLRYVAEMGTGHTPDRTKPEYWVDCDIPWVTAADLSSRPSEFEPLMETTQHVSGLGVANSAAVVHPAGTVMFCRTASVGLLTVIGRPMATTQAFVTWTPGPQLLSRYLLYTLAAMRAELFRIAYGSTHLTIYMPDLEALRIPLPSLDEQQRTVDFLDEQVARIDRAAELRQRQSVVLQESLRAAAQHLLIARHTTVPLRRVVASVRTGMTPSPDQAWVWVEGHDDDGVGWLSPNCFFEEGPGLAVPSRWISRSAAHLFPRFEAGSTLVVGIGATAGRVAHLEETSTGNQQLTALTPSDAVLPRYLTWSVWSRQEILRETAPFTTLPILNNETLKALEIVVPTREQQSAIVDELDGRMREVNLARQLGNRWVSLADERKRALITAAVTGQFDITAARTVA